MTEESSHTPKMSQPTAFKAETRQLLSILIHSLYTEREIFLRELISNASDALTRMNFEMLTNREVLDPEVELCIRIHADRESQTLTISDSGIGMRTEEMAENLGTIAHSGARAFVDAIQSDQSKAAELIGQFGVGFYSAFMAAESIRVVSRSYAPDAEAAEWESDGSDTYTIRPAEKTRRGTDVIIKLKADATEFIEERRIREIIKKHSDYLAFPIYLGDGEQQINQQTALWRQPPRQVEAGEYENFYKQLTLEMDPSLTHVHLAVDAPVQMYALLYVPASAERGMFALRREDGLKLYSRKVLIQDYCKDLLPEHLSFVQGVVDSEDLPLNVSRESVQANRVMANLKKLVSAKVIDTLNQLARDDPEKYTRFWEEFGRYIKQGIATEPADLDPLYRLLRFRTSQHPDEWSSLEDITSRMKPGQTEIYYILGDDQRSVIHSPHLDLLRKQDLEALLLTDPLDSFVFVRFTEYEGHKFTNVASASFKLPPDGGKESEEPERSAQPAEMERLVELFKQELHERVSEVRLTHHLTESPARLVDAQGEMNPELQRVYRLLNKAYDPPKKILELNSSHPILLKLMDKADDQNLVSLVVNQVYENALLIEGLHPDPAGMIERIQKLMQAAME